MNHNTKLIIYLLRHGANLEIKNNKGKFPVDVAMDKNYTKIAKALTKYSYIIEDENYYKLKEMVNSEKYDELLIKKYKEYEEEENSDIDNKKEKIKNKSKTKSKNNKKKKITKTKKINSNKKITFKTEKEKEKDNITTNLPFLSTQNKKNNNINKKNDIINLNLNLSPIKNKTINLNNEDNNFFNNKNENKETNIINNNNNNNISIKFPHLIFIKKKK
jgi:hypothetical protein